MNTTMPIEIRAWIKEQLRAMECDELDDDKKGLMIELIEQSIDENKAEIFAILLKEVLEEEKKEEVMEQLNNEGDDCYGVGEVIIKRYIITPWRDYLVEFDKDGEQLSVYTEDKNGIKLCEGKRLLMRYIEDCERLVLVDCNYELKEYPDNYKVEETWVINY